jgi:hypothetical protein
LRRIYFAFYFTLELDLLRAGISDFLGAPHCFEEFVNSRSVLAVCGNFRATGSSFFAAEL